MKYEPFTNNKYLLKFDLKFPAIIGLKCKNDFNKSCKGSPDLFKNGLNSLRHEKNFGQFFLCT